LVLLRLLHGILLKTEEYEDRLSFLSKRLKRCLRRFDTCYRLESDHFVVVMPHSTIQAAEALCENLMDDLAGNDRYDDLADVCVHPELYSPEDDVETLVGRIEGALNDKHA